MWLQNILHSLKTANINTGTFLNSEILILMLFTLGELTNLYVYVFAVVWTLIYATFQGNFKLFYLLRDINYLELNHKWLHFHILKIQGTAYEVICLRVKKTVLYFFLVLSKGQNSSSILSIMISYIVLDPVNNNFYHNLFKN